MVHKYDSDVTGVSPNLYYIGLNMIARAETLVDILEPVDNIAIPDDVLLEIEDFQTLRPLLFILLFLHLFSFKTPTLWA